MNAALPKLDRSLPTLLGGALALWGLGFATMARAADTPATNEPAPRVVVDYSRAPECEAFAKHAGVLVEEWYPRIRRMLVSDGQPPSPPVIRLTFEPMKGVAGTSGAHIHVSAHYVTVQNTNDYGMIIHELTHIAQDYRGAGEGWVTEGIADYVRYRWFEPGVLKPRLAPNTSYRDGYKTTAAFLIWVEANKATNIVQRLNAASRRNQPVRPVFQSATGQDLDALWREYADSLRPRPAATAATKP